MNEVETFFVENYTFIIIIILIFLGIILFLQLNNINLNTGTKPSKLTQQILIETFEMKNVSDDSDDVIQKLMSGSSENFCQSYLGKTDELENACNQLTKTNCQKTSCCVELSSNKCVAGTIDGPIYRSTMDGSILATDTYYYLGVKHG